MMPQTYNVEFGGVMQVDFHELWASLSCIVRFRLQSANLSQKTWFAPIKCQKKLEVELW